MKSILEIYEITTDQREVIYDEIGHFEAPNWSRNNEYLLLNGEGRLFKLDLKTKKKTEVDTGFAKDLNNDHGISPNGRQIVISSADAIQAAGKEQWLTSKIYILSESGGTPKLITPKEASFWHGWSPDGQTLVYTAKRKEGFDIYSIDLRGGKETRLTGGKWLDDGPDYSHDGSYIYYNSMQSGSMEIWRMKTDGSQKAQLTRDGYSNWFPHPSPAGGSFVFLSYLEDQEEAHPPMKRVALRLFDLQTNTIKTLCEFTGGQGSINVPSWSPDGRRFAFVSYENG
ncbi:TolB family protein [Psychroflexus sp. YR1-1]|uniref:TolB family protein n=1 Tax=Psychroflexus aurantiacus TaxID=2709310 RepID=A0A6B3R8A4_9FLAO|nr:PD40 domain-containing protein [Psychroflexus aurantiacus]NEV93744.1 TolB family protein [Psychroflexus aurantiacus]